MPHKTHTLDSNCLNALRDALGVHPEPYVDLCIVTENGKTRHFQHVRGVKWEDGMLTFEDEEERIYYVPDVAFWSNTYCEQ